MPSIPLIGEELAGYRLRSVLGRGGMSVVFQAENLRLGNVVALKVLAPELSSDDRFRTRFLQESRTAASLNHPNVIPIYDSGTFEDLLYLSMRYVSGADLRRVLRAHSRLSADQALLLIGQTGRALDAAHRHGLVHRDIKPGNILVERAADDEPEHVYLADFGITKHATSISGLTSTGQFVGTLDYIAPEQIRGGHVDARTDIYSLGCVFYECLTGRVPFQKDVDAAVIWAHVEEAPDPPSVICPDLPAALDSVIATAMAKTPQERYETCREFMAAAREALADVVARPVSRDVQRPETTEPPSVLAPLMAALPNVFADTAAAAGLPAAPASPGVAVTPAQPPPGAPPGERGGARPAGEPPSRPPADPSPDRSRGRPPRRLIAAAVTLVVIVAAVIVGVVFQSGSGSGSPAASSVKHHPSSPVAMTVTRSSTVTSTTAPMKKSAAASSTLMTALAQVNTNHYSRALLPPASCHEQSSSIVTCTNPASSVNQVTFRTYPSLNALYSAYVGQYRAITGGRLRTNFNDCNEADDHGEVSWNHAGKHSRTFSLQQLTAAKISPDDAFGRLFCTYSTGYEFYIVWTQNQGRLLGVMTGGPHNATWDWWHKVHHEISISGAAMSMSTGMGK